MTDDLIYYDMHRFFLKVVYEREEGLRYMKHVHKVKHLSISYQQCDVTEQRYAWKRIKWSIDKG